MTTTEFNILEQLATYGPLSATELHAGGLYPESRTWQAYAGKLPQLEQRGFVRRCGDRSWGITARGREVVAL